MMMRQKCMMTRQIISYDKPDMYDDVKDFLDYMTDLYDDITNLYAYP